MSAGLISRFGRCFLFATGKPHPSRQARLRGRRPLWCSAARGAVRNAKQKKAVPAKNSEAIFWRPRFTWPLRAGKRANANFACSEGFFCARRAAPCGRLAVLARPAAVMRAFVPGAPAFFLPVLRCLVPGLRAVCCFCAWSGLRCRGLLAGNVPALPCAAFFVYLLPFPA